MNERFRGFVGGAALILAAGGAHAATIEASGAMVDYFVIGETGELSTFGADIDFSDGVSVADAELSLAVGIPLTDPLSGASGGFDVTDGDDLSLEGMLSAVAPLEDAIELSFDNLGGPLAGAFGSTALVRIDFDERLGENAIEGLSDGGAYLAAITVTGDVAPQITPIPLPASGVLMTACLVLTGFYGAHRRRLPHS